MFCVMCGTKVADNANACPNCGHVFSAPQAAPAQPAPEAAPVQAAPAQPAPEAAPVQAAPAQPAPAVAPVQVAPQQYQQPAPQQYQQAPQYQQVPPQPYQQVPQYQQPMAPQYQQVPPQQYQQGYAQPYPAKPPFDLFNFVCSFFGRFNRDSALFQLIVVGILLVEFILWIIYPGAAGMNGFSGFGEFFSMSRMSGAMVVAGIFHILSFLALGGSIALLFLKKLAKRDFLFKIGSLAYAGCKLIVFIVVVASSSGKMVLGGDIAAILLSVGVFILSLQIEKKEALMNPGYFYATSA